MPTLRARSSECQTEAAGAEPRYVNIRALRRARITARSTPRWTTASADDRRDRARFVTVLAPVIDECLAAAHGNLGEYCRLIRQRVRNDPAFAAAWNADSNW